MCPVRYDQTLSNDPHFLIEIEISLPQETFKLDICHAQRTCIVHILITPHGTLSLPTHLSFATSKLINIYL